MRTDLDPVARQRHEFGRWLSRAREDAGYTQEQAADRAGVNRVTWARWETGTNGITRATIPAVADAVHKPEDETYTMAGLVPPGQEPDQQKREIADRLRSRRDYLRMTADDVADAINIPRSTYTQYETARVHLPSELVKPLCRVLGVSSDWLFGLGDTDIPEPPRGSGIDPGALEELKRFLGDAIRAAVAKEPDPPSGSSSESLPGSSMVERLTLDQPHRTKPHLGPLPGGLKLAPAC